MSDAPAANRILYANPEHGGIRIAVIVTIAGGLIGGYVLIRFLIGWLADDTLLEEFATVISCTGAIPIALGFAWVVEAYLKKTWSSGLEIELGDDALCFEGGRNENGGKDVRTFELDQRINLTNWYFSLQGYSRAGRERRVSDKWYCLANQIQQDGERLITFSFFPPDKAQEWIENRDLADPFHKISLSQLYKESGSRRWSGPTRPGEIPSAMLAGPDGRYWIAERRRWDEGLELTEADFSALMTYLVDKEQTDF
jgi:hypothetical protein